MGVDRRSAALRVGIVQQDGQGIVGGMCYKMGMGRRSAEGVANGKAEKSLVFLLIEYIQRINFPASMFQIFFLVVFTCLSDAHVTQIFIFCIVLNSLIEFFSLQISLKFAN